MNFNHDGIFEIKNTESFKEYALQLFRYQAGACTTYANFLAILGCDVGSVSTLNKIPFLPIEFFKTQQIVSSDKPPEILFTSSGTTGMAQSKHAVTDVSLYEKSYLKAFNHFYGNIKEFCFLALLPSYQERNGSSLIYMVDDLIAKSDNSHSGYFLNNDAGLYKLLLQLKAAKQKTVLIGVTYALLDFIERYDVNFPELTVMETGGMKGKRTEMVREALHQQLAEGFGVEKIHSEYGMTELLSQAYSTGDGIFVCPHWMKVLVRDVNDPFSYVRKGKTGGINVIDLANINSCSFIATQDLGRLNEDDSFEVLGRFDHSDIRGCNLLVQ
ncbi:MAG: acyl transferase [Pedobacter sp.]|nr:acyl transferase [Pedobacter sp.]